MVQGRRSSQGRSATRLVRAGQPLDQRRGTLRGVHFADVPPGQAQVRLRAARGAVLDVIVDIRVGSPTFGVCDAVGLDGEDRRGSTSSEGLGHAFIALTDDANVTYLVHEPYNPAGEHGINPLDPALDLPFPNGLEPCCPTRTRPPRRWRRRRSRACFRRTRSVWPSTRACGPASGQ